MKNLINSQLFDAEKTRNLHTSCDDEWRNYSWIFSILSDVFRVEETTIFIHVMIYFPFIINPHTQRLKSLEQNDELCLTWDRHVYRKINLLEHEKFSHFLLAKKKLYTKKTRFLSKLKYFNNKISKTWLMVWVSTHIRFTHLFPSFLSSMWGAEECVKMRRRRRRRKFFLILSR